jgi:hypothetical protein
MLDIGEGVMKERPAAFIAQMVQAILADRKTMTRRVIKPQPILCHSSVPGCADIAMFEWKGIMRPDETNPLEDSCPYGRVGDHLWVREVWALEKKYDRYPGSQVPKRGRARIWYLADGLKPEWAGRTRAARFMPRWASRLNLEITAVRVERLQEITPNDVLAEGLQKSAPLHPTSGYWFGPLAGQPNFPYAHANEAFAALWDSLNAQRGYGWDVNPFVFVISFTCL